MLIYFLFYRHLAENTTIPVPKVLACCTEDGTDPLSTFMILEYVEGKHLSQAELHSLSAQDRTRLYTSLADFYVQLRRQEFPRIGRLERKQMATKSGPAGICVREKTASLDMNMMQLEGLDPFSIQNSHHDKSGQLKSANAYSKMLLSVGYNAFLKSRNAATAEMGLECLYNHYLFSKHVETWIDPALDMGPFVLVHGDLHLSNLLVDNEMRIVSVLDWEWSRVVPVQYFAPPFWLSDRDTTQLAHAGAWEAFRRRHLSEFLTILKTQEEERYGRSVLHDEWARRTETPAPLVANALESWTEVDWFVHQNLASQDEDAAEEELSEFAKEDPLRSLLAEIKEQDYKTYQKELDALHRLDEAAKREEGRVESVGTGGIYGWVVRLQESLQERLQESMPTAVGVLSTGIAASAVMVGVLSKIRPSLRR